MALAESGTAKESLEDERLTKVLDSDLWPPPMPEPLVVRAETLQDKSDECLTMGLGGLASFRVANSDVGF